MHRNKYFLISIYGAIIYIIILSLNLLLKHIPEFIPLQFPDSLIKYLVVHFKTDLCDESTLFPTQQIARTPDIKVAHGNLKSAAQSLYCSRVVSLFRLSEVSVLIGGAMR